MGRASSEAPAGDGRAVANESSENPSMLFCTHQQNKPTIRTIRTIKSVTRKAYRPCERGGGERQHAEQSDEAASLTVGECVEWRTGVGGGCESVWIRGVKESLV